MSTVTIQVHKSMSIIQNANMGDAWEILLWIKLISMGVMELRLISLESQVMWILILRMILIIVTNLMEVLDFRILL